MVVVAIAFGAVLAFPVGLLAGYALGWHSASRWLGHPRWPWQSRETS